ncbi:RNA-binding protein [Candidatus Microgenomates bacterium]|nr:RNA-binding protein [Candidatus Microgenomates bacterium]
MAKKLYVGNLPYTTTDDDLAKMFAEFGAVVSAAVISDKFSGRSKGFGFVEMEDDAAADEAIKQLNDKDFGGRNLRVSEARPKEER